MLVLLLLQLQLLVFVAAVHSAQIDQSVKRRSRNNSSNSNIIALPCCCCCCLRLRFFLLLFFIALRVCFNGFVEIQSNSNNSSNSCSNNNNCTPVKVTKRFAKLISISILISIIYLVRNLFVYFIIYLFVH